LKESHRETIEKIQKGRKARTYGDGMLRELVKLEYRWKGYFTLTPLKEQIAHYGQPVLWRQPATARA